MFVLYHTQDISVRMVRYPMTSIRARLVQCLIEQTSPQLMNAIPVLSATTAGKLSLYLSLLTVYMLLTKYS